MSSVKDSHSFKLHAIWCYLLMVLPLNFDLNAQIKSASDDFPIRNDIGFNLIGKVGEKVLMLEEKNNMYNLLALDNEDLHLIFDRTISLNGNRPFVIDAFKIKDSFGLVYKYREKNTQFIACIKFDNNGNPLDTLEIQNSNSYGSTTVKSISSKSNRYCALFFPKGKGEIETIVMDLWDWKILGNVKTKVEDFDFDEDFHNLLLDEHGMIYLLLELNNSKSKMDEHSFELISLNAIDGTVEKNILNVHDFLNYHALLEFNPQLNEVCIAGLFSDKNKSKANGWFSINVKNRGRVYQVNKEYFPEQTIRALGGKLEIDNSGLPDLETRQLLFREDGGVIVICEKIKEIERFLNSPARGPMVGGGAARIVIDYYYEDLIVSGFFPSGKLHWSTVLPKRQYSQDDNAAFSSYGLLITPKKMRFIFNDQSANDGVVNEYVVYFDGRYNRNSIMNTKRLKLGLRFRDGFQTKSSEVLIPSEYNGKLKMVSLKI
jgi:hypothetical protein